MSITSEHSTKAKRKHISVWQLVSLILIALFLTFPLFIIIYNDIPALYLPFGDHIRIDHILTFILVFICVYYLARKIRYILYLLAGTAIFTMLILTLIGKYSFKDLYMDYSSFIYSLNKGPIQFEFAKPKKTGDNTFPKETEFRNAINYTNEEVRNYAAQIAVRHFEKYINNSNIRLIHFFSIFKEIRKRWRYVYDPSSGDYLASASETIRQLKVDGKFKGDCDDYSILMAACIKAVGGEVRLVRTQVSVGGQTTGHVYPEVYVGGIKDLENVNYLIKQVLFPKENRDEPIYYHVDGNERVWLNFDYNDYYPGGKYQSPVRIAELFI